MNPRIFFKCLADDTRLKSLLIISNLGEVCVCDLTNALQVEQPKISRHLAELRKCKLVTDNRKGKWVYYKINSDLPEWAQNILTLTLKNNSDYIKDNLKHISNCNN
ncbi:transcriptional regulator [Paraphotobacterium marinum]|uniref:Transcriptional regulator n=1 Tax=Paraphotobacterium marinum TaxID=1755811 RepID=A0A220VGD4_9GAMM|nr:metalloregulator ArsR/SmtB family transcription factor [Paraphotobacterium marinum]ASK79361.1 transcriptional regulator [Paraphotobacterium marinum]